MHCCRVIIALDLSHLSIIVTHQQMFFGAGRRAASSPFLPFSCLSYNKRDRLYRFNRNTALLRLIHVCDESAIERRLQGSGRSVPGSIHGKTLLALNFLFYSYRPFKIVCCQKIYFACNQISYILLGVYRPGVNVVAPFMQSLNRIGIQGQG